MAQGLTVTKAVPPPDKHYLLAAQGWIELGNFEEAACELEKIAPALGAHPDVLKVRWRVYGKTNDWVTALQMAKTICQLEPSHPFSRIHQACELPEVERRPDSGTLFQAIGSQFPYLFAVPYNLACYACQAGNLKEAWDWLQMAMEMCDIDEFRKIALKDTDLQPLWLRLSGG